MLKCSYSKIWKLNKNVAKLTNWMPKFQNLARKSKKDGKNCHVSSTSNQASSTTFWSIISKLFSLSHTNSSCVQTNVLPSTWSFPVLSLAISNSRTTANLSKTSKSLRRMNTTKIAPSKNIMTKSIFSSTILMNMQMRTTLTKSWELWTIFCCLKIWKNIKIHSMGINSKSSLIINSRSETFLDPLKWKVWNHLRILIIWYQKPLARSGTSLRRKLTRWNPKIQ